MGFPKQYPILNTGRLILRPFRQLDAIAVRKLAGTREVYETTMSIPHPYKTEDAMEWISEHRNWFMEQKMLVWAIVVREVEEVIGCISLNMKHFNAGEFGYWLGKDHWNNGYCTEALKAVLKLGFKSCGWNRIYAPHMKSNPASGKVMIKNGMKYEDCLRQHLLKDGKYEDLVYYGILRSEYNA